MGKLFDGITPELSQWIERQHMFFVATAPLAHDGLINCSPKGMDTFRILGPHEVAYLDLTGSGIETVAHARENGRIVFMFCAFDGPPKIVRLHGTCEVYVPGSPQYDSLGASFPGTSAVGRSFTRVSRGSAIRADSECRGTVMRAIEIPSFAGRNRKDMTRSRSTARPRTPEASMDCQASRSTINQDWASDQLYT